MPTGEPWPIEGMMQFELVLHCMECGWNGHSQVSAYFHLTHEHPALLARIAERNRADPDDDGRGGIDLETVDENATG